MGPQRRIVTRVARPHASARRTRRRLLRRSERHLDLECNAGRWVEAEDVNGGVMTRHSGDAGIEMRDVEGPAGPPEGVRLLAIREERLWSCRPRPRPRTRRGWDRSRDCCN